jgi:hypothetical protein
VTVQFGRAAFNRTVVFFAESGAAAGILSGCHARHTVESVMWGLRRKSLKTSALAILYASRQAPLPQHDARSTKQ